MPAASRVIAIALVLLLSLQAARVEATEHFNLEEGFPVEIEDAFPIAEHAREVQILSRFLRTEDGNNAFVLEPGLELHLTPKWPFKIAVPFETEEVRNGIRRGNAALEVFHNLNTEFGFVPAFAIAGRGSFPTASGSQGIDTTLKLIATKSLSDRETDRLHVNFAWRRNGGREEGERRNSYFAAIGYSRVFSSKTVLVADYVHEQELEKGKAAQFIELGLRQSLIPGTILSLGAGAGISKDAPDFRVTLGIQLGF